MCEKRGRGRPGGAVGSASASAARRRVSAIASKGEGAKLRSRRGRGQWRFGMWRKKAIVHEIVVEEVPVPARELQPHLNSMPVPFLRAYRRRGKRLGPSVRS